MTGQEQVWPQAVQLAQFAARAESAEERYRALFEGACDTISVLTPDGVVLEANDRWKDVLHIPPEELIGRHIRDFAAPGEADANLLIYANSQKSAERLPPVMLRRADGAIVYVEFSSSPIEVNGEQLVFCIGHDVTHRVMAARALEAAEQRYRSIVEQMPDAVWTSDQSGNVVYVSPNIERITGYSVEEILSEGIASATERIDAQDQVRLRDVFIELMRDGKPFDIEYRQRRKDLTWVWLRLRAVTTYERLGARYIDGMVSDVTERRRLEEELRHSQKMEAVGQLAGGIAHDFNNMLNILLGYTMMLLEGMPSTDPMHAPLSEMKRAGERSAQLTTQLLTFSRQKPHAPSIVDVNAAVVEVERLTSRMVGGDIAVVTNLSAEKCTVELDPGEIDQILINLIVNARDAMPAGGKLTIETYLVSCDDVYVATHNTVRAGRYVMIAVSDTGVGIDSQTQARIFEPFFTTKEVGKGTGLGLSIVFGIVQHHGGHVWVYSEPGRGTTFKVYLPLAEGGSKNAPAPVFVAEAHPGTETILLVEDEEQVRGFVEKVLRQDGYRILSARGPAEAESLCQLHGDEIDLLLTDVIMPLTNGKQLADQLTAKYPHLRVLFMSGYTDRVVLDHGVPSPHLFLQKPVAPGVLRRKVREVLGGTFIEAHKNVSS